MSLYNTQKKENSQQQTAEMAGVFPFWKNPGETLATLLRRFRDEQHLGPDDKITYAGRLDPMAEGIVLLLVREARFQKDMLLNRAKTYEVQILLGIATDTGDMLGLISARNFLAEMESFKKETIEKALQLLSEITSLPYPVYSSRPVDGKPLFMHARAGQKVVVPIKKITIHSLELVAIEEVELSELLDKVITTIKVVQGDFRQAEIIEQWVASAKATAHRSKKMQIITICTAVSSGTYMRSLAEKMGELLGVPALAYGIKRTAIEGIE
jgi:tRNA pseudouridine(55) synthase